MKSSKAPRFILAAALLSACAGPRLKLGLLPNGEVIDAVGSALIDSSNLEETRRKALADAQSQAVGEVVGVEVSAKTRVQNAVAINSQILSKSAGYIRQFQVLKEWKDPPLYKVKIRALVAYDEVRSDLKSAGILREPQIGNPRVAVLLTETAKGFDAPTFADDGLTQSFLDQGFRVVDRSDLMAAEAQAVAQNVANGDVSGVGNLGKKLDAEILVFGSVEGSQIQDPNFGGMISVRATLSAKAYQAQTGEVLASADVARSGFSATDGESVMKSFKASGKAAGEKLGPKILDALKRASFAELSVQGVSDLGVLKNFEDGLSSLPDAGDVYLRSFSDSRADIEVELKNASAQDLARQIEKIPGLSAQVISVTDQNLTVALGSSSGATPPQASALPKGKAP